MVGLRGRLGPALIACLLWTPGAAARPLQVEVAAPEENRIAWVSARHLLESGGDNGPDLVPRDPSAARDSDASDRLHVLSLHDLAREVPELGVVQLPFFYPDLAAVHRALDGALGSELGAAARVRGWEILAFWDEGLEVMSGNLAYTHARALQGMEFVLLRDDPMAEIELRALDVWSRRSRPASLAELQKECVVSSRSATLQQIRSEQLARVHLDLTLTRHRYEGWVAAMRSEAWGALDPEQRAALAGRLDAMRGWQRERAAQEEESALDALRKDGMTAHPLPPEAWTAYRALQPDWERFLPEALTHESRLRLVVLAAAAAGIDLGRRGREALPQTQSQAP